MDELLSIGRFARLSGLTVKALRHYHEVGLLVPADVDSETGYRRYRADQIGRAQAIARLRGLELSLDDVDAVLAGGGDVIASYAKIVEARIWRLQRIHYKLKRLLEGKDDLMAKPATSTVDHRQLGVDLFNHVWTLLENPKRTREEDDEMIHAVHASSYHWMTASECRPENRARSEWQVSRAYSVLGRAEPALYHARRCLELCEQHGLEDWDLAFAHEALARASRVAGDGEAVRRHVNLARDVSIAEPEDRELVEQDLATV
jgi:DNA-binding transcriptional MerR regulator